MCSPTAESSRRQFETAAVRAVLVVVVTGVIVGTDAIGNTPQEFARLIDSEINKWAGVVKASGAKVD